MINVLTSEKTLDRLQEWALAESLDLGKEWMINGERCASPSKILVTTDEIISQSQEITGVMHGDFCFPNIFFDFRQSLIRVIDPRGGIDEGLPSVFGDLLYDLAKLNHSLSGYDQIIAGRFRALRTDKYEVLFELDNHLAAKEIFDIFVRKNLSGQNVGDLAVKAITIQLFLAMLPLHSDTPDRQLAFFANALRLFRQLEV